MPIVYDGLAPLPKDMGIAELTRLANLRHAQARQADRAIADIMHRAISARSTNAFSAWAAPGFQPEGRSVRCRQEAPWMSGSDMTKPDT